MPFPEQAVLYFRGTSRFLSVVVGFCQTVDVECECADDKAEYHDQEQDLVPVGKLLYLCRHFVYACRLGELAPCIHIAFIPLFILRIVLVWYFLADQHPAESFDVHNCTF